ncbi:MAG TPA: BON domain-containing protein [Cyclobacteriaceae bacterium]|nr:BON domain-containing protein [Cyclobacteriaceae bacterium]
MDKTNQHSRRTNGNRRSPRDDNRRYAGDYYYNEQAWPARDEEWYRHTYGLPATGRRMGQRRHDIAEWGNPSFTQNASNREYDRLNENYNRNELRHQDTSTGDDYEYNRFHTGDQRGTWNQRNDESYNWGENGNRYQRPGLHQGKGPKGFIRSDERIREDINSRLTDDAHVDASEIDVSVESGEVTLTGTVPDRFEKRRAEDIADLVSGVKNVENRIRVKKMSVG